MSVRRGSVSRMSTIKLKGGTRVRERERERRVNGGVVGIADEIESP